MATQFLQQNRAIGVNTPLGEDALLLRSMTGTEGLSQPFKFDLDLLSTDTNICSKDLLGEVLTVRAQMPAGGDRYFSGLVSSFDFVGWDGEFTTYQATLRPWLWFLTRTTDCRIFQEMAVPDILKKVFDGHGFSDVEMSLSGSYRTWEFCAQYRETDFNFATRLMEQEGIYYFFAHSDGKHVLKLADSYSAHEKVAGYESVQFRLPETTGIRERDHVSSWSIACDVQPGVFSTTDFDFVKPKADLTAKTSNPRDHAHSELEIYDYPGEYVETGDGVAYARIRFEEIDARHETVQGGGTVAGLEAGCLFELCDCPREDQNREYLVTGITHTVKSDTFGTGGNSGHFYSCGFTAIDSRTPFRPPRTTPKPVVQGPQTAVVTGKSGEEIWTDKYGRVKVHFHWDREGKMDENSSCWIRVSQPWAGKGWGGMAIPRIGQEVIVEFLEGDPDRPIITGRVYNADNMPPYGLPGAATRTTIKSNSSKGGGGFNEVRFEDKKGEEEVYVQAEKDMNTLIKNNESRNVGADRSKSIGNNETVDVGNDRTENVGNNETISIGSNRTETVGQNENITIGMARTTLVQMNEMLTVGVARERTVGTNEIIGIGANRDKTVGASETVNIGANRATDIGNNQTHNVGKNRTVSIGEADSLTVGKKLTIDAGDEIMIKTGKASILMKKNGDITIQGKKITVKGSGNVIIKGKKILEN